MHDPHADFPSPGRADTRLLEHARTGEVEPARQLLEDFLAGATERDFKDRLQAAIDKAETTRRASGPAEAARLLVVLAEQLLELHLEHLAALILGLARRDQRSLSKLASDETNALTRPATEALADLDNATGVLALRWGIQQAANDLLHRSHDYADLAGSRGLAAAASLNLAHLATQMRDYSAARDHALLSLRAAEAADQPASVVRACLTLAQATRPRDGVDDRRRFAERAVQQAVPLRLPGLTASAHIALGLRLTDDGDYIAAERSFQLALDAARRAHSPERQVVALQNLAAVATDTGRNDLAVRRLTAAVDISERAAGRPRLANLLDALARAHHRRGDLQAAGDAAERLLSTAARGSSVGLARARALRGALLLDEGRSAEGLEMLREAQGVLLAEAPGDNEAGLATRNLATAHAQTESMGTIAFDLVDWATTLAEHGQSTTAGRLAVIVAQEGERWHGLAADLAAVATATAPRDERYGSVLALASQLTDVGAGEIAATLLRQVIDALTISAAPSDRALVLDARNDLAVALLDRPRAPDFDEAHGLLRENARRAEESEDRITSARAYSNLTELYRRRDHDGDHERAIEAAVRHVALAEDLDDPDEVAIARLALAHVHLDVDDVEEAARALDSGTLRPGNGANLSLLWADGHIALVRGDVDTSVRLYSDALKLVPAGDETTLYEALARLCIALAAAGNRRRFMRRMQQLVDCAQRLPFNDSMPVDLARPAREWSRRGKAQYAGQTLATCLLVCAAHAARDDGSNGAAPGHDNGRDGDDPNPIQIAALVVAVELLREEADGEDPRRARAALDAEVVGQLGGDRDAAEILSSVIDEALEVYRNHPDRR